jgi:hypothetical protein
VTFFMLIAAAYGVLQLAALGWFGGRSVRIGTLLLSVVVGMYGCGVVALVLQFLYTRGLVAASGAELSEVVRTASYTVDPFIEELAKVVPLLLVARHLRTRFQWGLTDFVVLGAGLGAGFGLLEAALRFSHLADQAVVAPGGWVLPRGLSATFVPRLGTTLGSWLPEPATSQGLLEFAARPETYLHLVWSAAAGLGVGVLLRGKGTARLLGLLPIAFVSAAHCAVNYDLSVSGGHEGMAGALTTLLLDLHQALWLFPLVCLAVAAYYDRRDLSRSRAALPGGPMSAEAGLEPGALGRFASLRLPWTLLIALRFVRLDRSLAYARARGPDEAARPLAEPLRRIREQIGRAGTAAAWERTPTLRDLARAVPGDAFLRNWRFVVWLGLLLPSLVFLVIGGFPATAGLQDPFRSAAATVVLIPILVAALLWLGWQILGLVRTLPDTARQPYGDVTARARFRLMSGAGSLVSSATCLWLLGKGTGLDQRAVANGHVLDALAGALTVVLLVLALAAIITMFPPGGLALAFGGGGAMAAGVTVTPALLGEAALVGALSGLLLAQASDGGSSDGGTPGESSPGGSGRPSNADRFAKDNFEDTGYSMDDVASMTHRHTGSGDMHLGGSAPRPTESEILEALTKGKWSEVEASPNTVQYVWNGIRVLVNRQMPWQSTSYYIGG